MPAVIPLVVAGVSAYASYKTAKSGADASKQASQVQVDASNKAMDYQQQQQRQAMQYAERMRTMPLQGPPQGGAQSYLSQLMRIPGGSNSFSGAPPMASSAGYQFQPAMGNAAGSGGGNLGYAGLMGGPSAGGGMVMLQAPTGEQQSVPADQAQAYIARGARRVS